MKKIAACPSKLFEQGGAKSLRKQTRFAGLFQTGFGSKLVILLFFFFSLFTLTLTFAPPVHAQKIADCPQDSPAEKAIDVLNKEAISKNVFDDKIFNLNQIAGTTDSLLTLLTGCSQLHSKTNTATAGTGALAASGKLVSVLYGAPPASGVNYFASQIQKFSPVQPAYAQDGGVGFAALSPIQKIWSAFRNIAYVGFVIIFVIIGFMIMFRAHISPQAVATVQDSIPRIVVALILVTFSYAIAGLMIDVMFVFLNVVINALQAQNLLTPAAEDIFRKSIFGVVTDAWQGIVKNVYIAIQGVISDVIKTPLKLNEFFGILGGGIAGIVVGIAVLLIMFRVFLMLLMAYVTIIILTIAAPFFFLIQALPGNTGAREWFKQMAANVSVFPTVALMILFAGMLGGIGSWGGSALTKFDPGQVGQFPLLSGDLKLADIGALIGLGFLLMTPTAAQMMKEMIGAKGPNLGGAIGAGLAAGAAPVGAFAKGAGGAAWTRGPIGGWRRAQEARRQEQAQTRAGLRTYTQDYRERQEEEARRQGQTRGG